MFEMWMPLVSNVLLLLFGFVFTLGGGNTFSKCMGILALIVSVLSLAVNTGILK